MANSQAKLMYPGLSGFYETMLPIAETFVRIVVGVMFLMHVSGKLTAGPAAFAGNMAKSGLEPAIMWAYVIIFLELVGGICLIIGLFTRFANRKSFVDRAGLRVRASQSRLGR
jgi:putative oxidoreductase